MSRKKYITTAIILAVLSLISILLIVLFKGSYVLNSDEAVKSAELVGTDLHITFTDKVEYFELQENYQNNESGNMYISAKDLGLAGNNNANLSSYTILALGSIRSYKSNLKQTEHKLVIHNYNDKVPVCCQDVDSEGRISQASQKLIYINPKLNYSMLELPNYIILPKLTLNYYFLSALIVLLVSVIVTFSLKNKNKKLSKAFMIISVLAFSYVLVGLITGNQTYRIGKLLPAQIVASVLLSLTLYMLIRIYTSNANTGAEFKSEQAAASAAGTSDLLDQHSLNLPA